MAWCGLRRQASRCVYSRILSATSTALGSKCGVDRGDEFTGRQALRGALGTRYVLPGKPDAVRKLPLRQPSLFPSGSDRVGEIGFGMRTTARSIATRAGVIIEGY
jgi:hypothetical protein